MELIPILFIILIVAWFVLTPFIMEHTDCNDTFPLQEGLNWNEDKK